MTRAARQRAQRREKKTSLAEILRAFFKKKIGAKLRLMHVSQRASALRAGDHRDKCFFLAA
jgi:hypothetical protein